MCIEPYRNKNLKYVPIGDVLSFSQYGISIEMNEEGAGTRIYRMNEISNMLCDRDILKHADLSANEVAAYKLNDKDVLFNRTNSQTFVGRTGLFRKLSNEDIVFASYLIRVNPDPEIVTPEYLIAFLNTKYGVLDVKRRARISINQSNVNAEELKRVELPILCDELQMQITLSFDRAIGLIQASERKYQQAQAFLLSELRLADWQPKRQQTFVRSYSDARRAGRNDAEYFQPRYDEIISAIKSYPGGWATQGKLVQLKDREFKPDDRTTYKYIELANIGGSGEITDCMVEQGQDLPSRARRRVATGDVIVSSIEGSLSSIALIDVEYHHALCTTGFHVINSQQINVETLLVILKSVVGQLQLKKGCSGTILTAINKDELSKLVLPVLPEEKQTQIQERITESFNFRKRSKHLLECAKRAVEVAIEQDEQAAIDWLENQTAETQIGLS